MRYHEIKSLLTEAVISKSDITEILKKSGYENVKFDGTKIQVLVQIPNGRKKEEFRRAVLQELLEVMKRELGNLGPQYSDDASLSSIGGIVFANSNYKILVKDAGKQGDNSAGVANEIELASILQSCIEKYGTVNVTFIDPRNKKLTINDCNRVEIVGRDTAERKKSDVILHSESDRLPVSIKKVNADMWESADSLFGKRARKILDQLVDDGVVSLKKIKERKVKNGVMPVYELNKEIVMEPTEEEAMKAIFGSDLNPKGGVVIQTFKPEHFKQKENEVEVDCHAVITKKDDIPESHLMVWVIRNDADRNSQSLGLAGIRPLGVTLTRGIGKRGDKDVVLVDQRGNVIENPNVKKNIKKMEKDLPKDSPELEKPAGREKRRKK